MSINKKGPIPDGIKSYHSAAQNPNNPIIINETKFRMVDCQVNSEPVLRDEDSFIPRKSRNLVSSVNMLLVVDLRINQR